MWKLRLLLPTEDEQVANMATRQPMATKRETTSGIQLQRELKRELLLLAL